MFSSWILQYCIVLSFYCLLVIVSYQTKFNSTTITIRNFVLSSNSSNSEYCLTLLVLTILSHLVLCILDVAVGDPLLEGVQQLPAGVGQGKHGQVLLALLDAGSSEQDVAHHLQAAVSRRSVSLSPAHRAAVAAAESFAVPQEPVEPQAELQKAEALRPVLRLVLLQSVVVGRLQRHDVLLGETSEAVLLILGLEQRREQQQQQRAAEEQPDPVQEHLHLHRLQQEQTEALKGSEWNFLRLLQECSCLPARRKTVKENLVKPGAQTRTSGPDFQNKVSSSHPTHFMVTSMFNI